MEAAAREAEKKERQRRIAEESKRDNVERLAVRCACVCVTCGLNLACDCVLRAACVCICMCVWGTRVCGMGVWLSCAVVCVPARAVLRFAWCPHR